jgi:hypothetical protein
MARAEGKTVIAFDIVLFIAIAGIAALVSFMVARDKAGWLVVALAAIIGIAVGLVVSVIGTFAVNRSLAIDAAAAAALLRLYGPATLVGAVAGIWWARQYREGL